MRVVLISNRGEFLRHPERALILKLPNDPLDGIFVIQMDRGNILNVFLHQIDLPSALEKKKDNTSQVMAEVVKRMNLVANSDYKDTAAKVIERKNNLVGLKESLKKTEVQLGKYQAKLKGYKQNSIKEDHIIGEIESIKKHAKIKDAYITERGNLIVKTKMLYKLDGKTHKENRKVKVGEFIFRFQMGTASTSSVSVFNTTYYLCSNCINETHDDGEQHSLNFGHPVLDMYVCFGHHAVEVQNMLKKLSFYQLADFMVLLFSVYPDPDNVTDSPFIPFDVWDDKKRPFEKYFITPDIFKEGKIKWPKKKN